MTKARLNTILFACISVSVFAFILTKALQVPITHDEVMTSLFYSKYTSWEIMMYPDAWPNNHILNTLLTKWSMLLLGQEQWVIRLPNILSFVLFLIGIRRILTSVVGKESILFVSFTLILMANPYFLDFFSLCRGYGMSCALSVLAISYLISGYKNETLRHIWYAVLFGILASYANFSLLVFWAAISLLVGWYFLMSPALVRKARWMNILFLIVTSVGYLFLIAPPILKMREADQFKYWTDNGFFEDTIVNLVDLSLKRTRVYGDEMVAYAVLTVLLVSSVIAAVKLVLKRFRFESFKSPFVLSFLIISLTIGINLVQCWLFDLPNLKGRISLFFFPLFMILVVSWHEILKPWKVKGLGIFAAVVVTFIGIQHLTTTSNWGRFKEWDFDRHTFTIINYIDQDRNGKDVGIETHWLYNPSVYFYCETGKTPWLDLHSYSNQIDTTSTANYYYAFDVDYPKLERLYVPVLKLDDQWLMKLREDSDSLRENW